MKTIVCDKVSSYLAFENVAKGWHIRVDNNGFYIYKNSSSVIPRCSRCYYTTDKKRIMEVLKRAIGSKVGFNRSNRFDLYLDTEGLS